MFKKFVLGSLLVLFIGFVIICIVVGIVYLAAPDRYNVLIIGTDQRGEERSRSDVLMVFSVPKSKKKQTTVLTIPRDTMVEIPGEGKDKITHSYVYGEREEGEKLGNVDLTKETVEDFLDMKIDAVFEFNFESFKEIVDKVDGISVDGAKMTGEKALEIVRNRYREGGDFARTEDQREVFRGMIEKLKSKANATKILDYIEGTKDARLDYNRRRLIHFGIGFGLNRWTMFLGFGRVEDKGLAANLLGEIVEEVVPGSGGTEYSEKFGQELYFWTVDEEKMNELRERALE